MPKMPIWNVEDFQVYQKVLKLFDDFPEEDLPVLKKSFKGRTLAGNKLRCLDSICANMQEGYERKAGKEIKYFFRISKGSSGEARGRYKRLRKLLSKEALAKRIKALNKIRAMLESLINKWKFSQLATRYLISNRQ